MTYPETIQYLYAAAPLFQQQGGAAYKEGLSTTHTLDAHFGHPHRTFRTVHIAGTNGKGSTASTLAAMLQLMGLRVGLYTSPHLLDFRERIRVNGAPIPEAYVVDFVERERHFFEPLHPSFFELTTALAFRYFADEAVDVAVIEVGLGGRLDCTNIITPVLSVITNISLDHTQFLGHDLAAIAHEKAGIIKSGVPAIVGEFLPETRPVFTAEAEAVGAPLVFAEDEPEVLAAQLTPEGLMHYTTRHFGSFHGILTGDCQARNANTVLTAARFLLHTFPLPPESRAVQEAFMQVNALTGLRGRWETLQERPRIICDTGHNEGGWQFLGRRLHTLARDLATKGHHLHILIGMAADKDVSHVLALAPPAARYYFTAASVRRALDAASLQALAAPYGLHGEVFPSVVEALQAVQRAATPDDVIFVGGSTFVVADFLTAAKGLF